MSKRQSRWGKALRRKRREASDVVAADGTRQPMSLKMDPLNPPTTRRYTGPTGKRSCHCHGWPIEQDTDVLWWPNPDTGGVLLFCQEGVKEMQQA